MGNFCSCLDIDRPKHIISVIGLEDDIKNVLVHIVPNYDAEKKLSKFSEYAFVYRGYNLVIHTHIVTPMIKTLIKLHFPVESAIIYSVNADDYNSISSAKLLIEDEEVKTRKDIVTVLCRGKYLENPALQEMKNELNGNVHSHAKFVKFGNDEAEKVVQRTFDDVCDKLNS